MHKGKWVGGLAEWSEENTLYLSVAFTWELDRAYSMALFARALGKRVVSGGPALFLVKMQHMLTDVSEIGTHYPDAVAKHNPLATFASRGCPVGCGFCIVPAMEGREFTLLHDFPVRPVLCDNNLSALPADYQDYIIARYAETGTPLLDANSGFAECRAWAVEIRLRRTSRTRCRPARDEDAFRRTAEAQASLCADRE